MRGLVMLATLGVLAVGDVARAEPAIADDRCQAAPKAQPTGFRHRRSKLLARLGAPNHRGIDLIAAEADRVQRVAGKLAYTTGDKDLQDEDVEVFACVRGEWSALGMARTDSDGRFQLALEGAARLPVGMRDLYLRAAGDGTGAWFVGYVAAAGTSIVVTDIDGTLSWSENSIIRQVVRGTDIRHRPHAPEALRASRHPVVYVTTRGDLFTGITRAWLTRHGFPRGVLRLSHGFMARSGDPSIAYKSAVFRSLTIPIVAGIGNRKTDITAYTSVGVPANQIFIHLPEFEREVRAELDAKKAVGFADYRELSTLLP
jgi:hypothetical protein